MECSNGLATALVRPSALLQNSRLAGEVPFARKSLFWTKYGVSGKWATSVPFGGPMYENPTFRQMDGNWQALRRLAFPIRAMIPRALVRRVPRQSSQICNSQEEVGPSLE